MGATNSTTNLQLPQFIGTDKPSWLGDFNGAMLKVDNFAGTATSDIGTVTATANAAKSTAEAAEAAVGALETTVTQHTTEISDAMGDIASIEADISDINNKIATLGGAKILYSGTIFVFRNGTWNNSAGGVIIGDENNSMLSIAFTQSGLGGGNIPTTEGFVAALKIAGNPLNAPTTPTVTHGAFNSVNTSLINGIVWAPTAEGFTVAEGGWCYVSADNATYFICPQGVTPGKIFFLGPQIPYTNRASRTYNAYFA